MLSAGFVGLMGAVFLWWGLMQEDAIGFPTVLGPAFLLYGAIQFIRMSRLAAARDT